LENKINQLSFKVQVTVGAEFRTVQNSSDVRQKGDLPNPPPVIPVPESIAAQAAAFQLRYENTEYYSWVGSGPKCFQVLGLSPSLLQDPML
jgi:hypothetical protein